MRQEKPVKVGEVTYQIKELRPFDRDVILFKIINIVSGLAPSVDAMINLLISTIKEPENLDKSIDEIDLKVGDTIKEIVSKLDPEETAILIEELIKKSVVQPNLEDEKNYDMHFTKYYSNRWVLIFRILLFNYNDSFSFLKKKSSSSKNKILDFLEALNPLKKF